MRQERYELMVNKLVRHCVAAGQPLPYWMDISGVPDVLPFISGRHEKALDMVMEELPEDISAKIIANLVSLQPGNSQTKPPGLSVDDALYLAEIGALRRDPATA